MSFAIQASDTPVSSFKLQIRPPTPMDDHQLLRFCQLNRDLQIERTAEGDLILMSPATPDSGWRNAQIILQLGLWAEQDGTGIVFDSSSGFTLPNTAMRAPDAAWIRSERWQALSTEDKQRFSPICPDFVIELRSPSDSLKDLRNKMSEYIDSGSILGWLIDPSTHIVYVYRPDRSEEILGDPSILSGDPELPGLRFNLQRIW